MKTFEVEQIVSSIFNKVNKHSVVDTIHVDKSEVTIKLTNDFDLTFDVLQRLSNALATKKINVHHKEGDDLSEVTYEPSVNRIYVTLSEPIEKG